TRPVKVSIANDVPAQNNIDLLALDTSGALAANAQSADEGAFVIIARDNLAAPNVGRMNGRIYRLGTRRADLDSETTITEFSSLSSKIVYELQPGGDFTIDPGADGSLGTADDIKFLPGADAFVVGRNLVPGSSPATYEGAAQDISVYTTFIQP